MARPKGSTNKRYAGRPTITREELEELRGMLMVDIATELGRSKDAVSAAISKYGIRHLFPAKGGASTQIAQKGYIYG